MRDPILDSEILESRVQRAVTADLNTRGYVAAPSAGSADFLVTYHTVSKQKIESSGTSVGFGFMDAFPRGFGGVVVMAPPVESREEGTLMLDIMDGKSKRLVWRGWTTGWVDQQNYTDQAVAPRCSRSSTSSLPAEPARARDPRDARDTSDRSRGHGRLLCVRGTAR